ncbi:MAG: ATP-binding cassette protein [Chthoniobacteraceae bacterium]|nr:ATP-binding cassette protein [Chthoniobacteraceae bacterium]
MLKTAGRLSAHLRPFWPALLVVLPLGLLEVALDGALTLSYKFLIDYAITPHNRIALLTILGILAALVVLASVGSFWRDHFYARLSADMLGRLRTHVFAHSQRLSVSYYAGRSASDILTYFSTDLAVIESFVTGAFGSLILPALSVMMGVGLLFALLDWPVALAATLVWPLVLIIPSLVTSRAADAAHEKKKQETALLGTVEEAIGTHRVVKAFGLDSFTRQRFLGTLTPLSAGLARAAFLGALVERSTVISIYVLQFAALSAGAIMAYDGSLSVGSFIAFLTVFWSLGWSIVVLARSASASISAVASLRRIEQLLSESEDPLEQRGNLEMPPVAHSIALSQVQFSYPGHPPVLKAVSLHVAQGEFVALVGPSGSGKSSVLNLVARLYESDSGQVLVDGCDMNQFTARSIRARMGFVFQESLLFNTSIRENIRLGLPDASDEQVEDAAKAAEVHDAILALHYGYDTQVGERGALLSGGQRQRVAIARALIRNPSLLLLDEATSALDPVSESAINETLLRARQGRTTISVTHRLASVTAADRIFVIKAGTVVESGDHGSLLKQDGVYAGLWRKQHGFTVSDDGAVAEVTVERLREIPLLMPPTDAQLETLVRHFVCERVPAGRPVFSQGDQGNHFHIIVRGTMTVTRVDAGGNELEIARLSEGDEFGEMALLRNQPRNSTITAKTDCLILTLTREHFAALLESTPDVREKIEKLATERGGSR